MLKPLLMTLAVIGASLVTEMAAPAQVTKILPDDPSMGTGTGTPVDLTGTNPTDHPVTFTVEINSASKDDLCEAWKVKNGQEVPGSRTTITDTSGHIFILGAGEKVVGGDQDPSSNGDVCKVDVSTQDDDASTTRFSDALPDAPLGGVGTPIDLSNIVGSSDSSDTDEAVTVAVEIHPNSEDHVLRAWKVRNGQAVQGSLQTITPSNGHIFILAPGEKVVGGDYDMRVDEDRCVVLISTQNGASTTDRKG